MNERTLVGSLLALMVLGGLLSTKSMDAIFVAVSIGFFALCIAYAEGCGRL